MFAAAADGTGATLTDRLGHSLFKNRTSRWDPVETARLVALMCSTVTLGVVAQRPLWKALLIIFTLLLSEFDRIRSRIWVKRW